MIKRFCDFDKEKATGFFEPPMQNHKLTSSQSCALRDYRILSHATLINKLLMGTVTNEAKNIFKAVETIDWHSVINKILDIAESFRPSETDLVLFRGTNKKAYTSLLSTGRDKRFISTSLNPQIAYQFSVRAASPVEYTINVPKGSPIIRHPALCHDADEKYNNSDDLDYEKEVLLPPMQFRIERSTEQRDDKLNRPVTRAELTAVKPLDIPNLLFDSFKTLRDRYPQ